MITTHSWSHNSCTQIMLNSHAFYDVLTEYTFGRMHSNIHTYFWHSVLSNTTSSTAYVWQTSQAAYKWKGWQNSPNLCLITILGCSFLWSATSGENHAWVFFILLAWAMMRKHLPSSSLTNNFTKGCTNCHCFLLVYVWLHALYNWWNVYQSLQARLTQQQQESTDFISQLKLTRLEASALQEKCNALEVHTSLQHATTVYTI